MSARTSSEPTVIAAPSGRLREQWSELWRRRALLGYFGRRFVAKRSSRTWLGLLWLPLRPALTLGTRLLVFGGVLKVTAGHVPYPLFFIIASSAWQLFAESAYWSTRSLELHRRELRQMYVPRLVPLFSAMVPALLDFMIYLGFATIAAGYYVVVDHHSYITIGPETPLALAGIALTLALGLSIGLWTSHLAARSRDIRFGLAYVLGFWYFLTPVIYPISTIPESWRRLANLNPVLQPVELIKRGLLGTGQVTLHALLVTFAFILVTFVGGMWFFLKAEQASSDDA
jgi:lipopolysaccharide transport system permease protein